jgi:N-methylhydantoinase A
MGQYRVAVDTGGTFIDFVLLDEQSGRVRIEKEDSTAGQLAEQVLVGLRRFDVSIAEIVRLFHGTTVGINALVQERGARVGLITTEGFRDVLEMGRGGRTPVYNFTQLAPKPIVERYLRREVPQRTTFDGKVLRELDLEALDREVDYLLSQGVEAIAVAFLHAYANPAHERLARERIASRQPKLPVTLSHEISAEWREYERTSTAVLNAFIQPTVKNYIGELQRKLLGEGCARPLAIMQSSGGVADASTASEKPIRTLMSGPAGGVIGAKFLCDRLGYQDVICTDVGGTTYDVAIIENGRILERSQTDVAGRAVLGSMIDVMSVGAGGGSIAWLDHRNALQVGPQSAGATPGPACFGRGGTDATTTDAHLVLGRLDPGYFLGGRMKLDVTKARAAIQEKIAGPLGLGLTEAAHGILAIAEANMANAIRTKTVQRGLDPREFVMLAYGGGGGLFACAVAEQLGVRRVVVPVAPANFSAWGILTSDYVEDEVRTQVMPFDAAHVDAALETFAELERSAVTAVSGYGFEPDAISRLRRVDMRFEHQEFTITVDLEPDWTSAGALLDGARERFVSAHRRLYGHGDPAANLEVVSLRARAIGRVRAPEIARRTAPASREPAKQRDVVFRGSEGGLPTQIVARDSLASGRSLDGPAIIDEWTTTTIVPPGWTCSCDVYGNLVLEPKQA